MLTLGSQPLNFALFSKTEKNGKSGFLVIKPQIRFFGDKTSNPGFRGDSFVNKNDNFRDFDHFCSILRV